MKKTYQQPAISEMSMEENKPIAVSTLRVDNEPKDNIIGDVKAGGDWDIWGNDVTED
jgi:hypothetical protein